MKIAAVQLDVVRLDKAENLRRAESAVAAVAADLVVLPELFSTGYCFASREELLAWAEPVPGGETTRALAALAQKSGAALVAGLAERDGERLYNSAVVVTPGGFTGVQRKLHLPRLEAPLFERGEKIEVFEVAGTRIGVVICFDCWFPEIARILARKGARVLCHPANFGGPWSLELMRARAMENQLFAATSNRIGQETCGEVDAHFRGESQIVAPGGEVLAQAGVEAETISAEIEPASVAGPARLMCGDLPAEWERYELSLRDPSSRG